MNSGREAVLTPSKVELQWRGKTLCTNCPWDEFLRLANSWLIVVALWKSTGNGHERIRAVSLSSRKRIFLLWIIVEISNWEKTAYLKVFKKWRMSGTEKMINDVELWKRPHTDPVLESIGKQNLWTSFEKLEFFQRIKSNSWKPQCQFSKITNQVCYKFSHNKYFKDGQFCNLVKSIGSNHSRISKIDRPKMTVGLNAPPWRTSFIPGNCKRPLSPYTSLHSAPPNNCDDSPFLSSLLDPTPLPMPNKLQRRISGDKPSYDRHRQLSDSGVIIFPRVLRVG